MSLESLFGNLSDVLGQTSVFVKDSMGAINDITRAIDPDDSTGPATPSQPAYNPNLAASNFAFQPNWTLLAGGAILLIIAMVLLKK